MPRPITPIVFIAIFLAVVIAAVLMFAIVLSKHDDPETTSPKQAIALQLALLKEGDAVSLRLTFTERLRVRITPEVVAQAKPAYQDVSLDDLVGTVTERELEDGGREARVVTAGGRDLTRLVLIRGDWLVDSVWFP